jgi:hypothetical protein
VSLIAAPVVCGPALSEILLGQFGDIATGIHESAKCVGTSNCNDWAHLKAKLQRPNPFRRHCRTVAIAVFNPRRRPLEESVLAKPGASPANIFSLRVSGASSAVSDKYVFGSDSLAMVRHALPYWIGSEPVV